MKLNIEKLSLLLIFVINLVLYFFNMKITVTQKDIKNGKHNAAYCPIALAVDRVLGSKETIVGTNFVATHNGLMDLPLKAKRFIEKFDAGKPVKGFTFKLKLKNY